MISGALVLASGSVTRHALLTAAGLTVERLPSQLDEQEVKRALRAEGADAAAIADRLAELKARRAARRRPGALVIGADQMLECDNGWFDKPTDRAQAAAHLRALSGRAHLLISAVTVCRDDQRLWGEIDRARLTMRTLSDAFIDDYLDRLGAAALTSVGAYQLEGLGAQLFERVEGDFFTVLGLPLLPLLGFLRAHGAILT